MGMSNIPFSLPPGDPRGAKSGDDQAFRDGDVGAQDQINRGAGDDRVSELADRPYRSSHETDNYPPRPVFLLELLAMRHYQIYPNDRACAERIERLQAQIAAYDRAEASTPWSPPRRTSAVSVSPNRMATSTFSTLSDHFPPESPTREASSGPMPEPSWERWLGDDAPNPTRCLELFRLVLIGVSRSLNAALPVGPLYLRPVDLLSKSELMVGRR